MHVIRALAVGSLMLGGIVLIAVGGQGLNDVVPASSHAPLPSGTPPAPNAFGADTVGVLAVDGELVDHVGIVWDAIIDPTSVPDATDFSVSVNGAAGVAPTAVDILYSGLEDDLFGGVTFMRLGLDFTWTAGIDHLTLSYVPGVSPVRDYELNAALPFTDMFVEPWDFGAMELLAISLDERNGRDRILVGISNPIDSTSIPGPADFSVSVAGTELGVVSVRQRFGEMGIGILELELADTIDDSTLEVTLDYVPGGSPITSLRDGSQLSAFFDAPVGLILTPGIVTADATRLQVDGQPYEFTGMNVYNANTRVQSCWYPFDQASLEASFAAIGSDVGVIRAWFFQDFATKDGLRDWSAFDTTFAAARASGKKVIVTLGNQWPDCDTEGLKEAVWYGGGYREAHPSLPSSYRDYVAEVVRRYASEPSVLMWQLLNEAEVPLFTTEGLCDEEVAHPLLRSWADDVSTLVKSIDPIHLVSIGTIGSGQCGAQFTDYASLHDLPNVDLCEFHDYGTTVMPGDQWNGLQFRLEQCSTLGKPLFVGETGITPDWLDGTFEARAELFRAKLFTQMAAGVVGEVLWAWNAFESLAVTYDIGPGDPVFEVLAWVPGRDADVDGVDDRIDAGPSSFDDGAGTTGTITSTAGHSVVVFGHPDGVRITVVGTGTAAAGLTVCGVTVELAAGSDVLLACGSITAQVIEGTALMVLGDGLITVSIPAGVTARVAETVDGQVNVAHLAGDEAIDVAVGGVATTVAPGSSLDLQAWQFVGFERPVEQEPVRNVVKAGQAVPLKWRLLDSAGAPVTDLTHAVISVRSLSCTTGSSEDLVTEDGTGGSGLQNLGDGYYQLNWRTPTTYAESCKTLRLDIGDGVLHTALFRFTR